jgi:type I restriction enzyme, S subunit
MHIWQLVKIKDLGTVVGGGTPSTVVDEHWKGEVPWITPKDLSDYSEVYITKGARNISQQGLSSSSAILVSEGTVLFSSRAPIGYVAIAGCELATNQGFKSIIPNEEKIISKYLYYVMVKNAELVKYRFDASTFAEISGGDMKNLELLVTLDINEQKKISDILSSLDDKIELNRKMNEVLEEMGQTLFRHWFVDFEFPWDFKKKKFNWDGKPYKSSGGEMVDSELGMIPRSWEVKSLGQVTNISLGGTPARSDLNFWDNGTVPWVNSGKVNEKIIIQPSELITKEAVLGSATKLLPAGTVVVAITGATLGQYSILGIDSCFNQSVVGISETNEIKKSYFYYYIANTINRLISGSGGGAQQHINKELVSDHKIVLPETDLINAFQEIVDEFINLQTDNYQENNYLSQTRDLLLPRLMSGKLRVPLNK